MKILSTLGYKQRDIGTLDGYWDFSPPKPESPGGHFFFYIQFFSCSDVEQSCSPDSLDPVRIN